MYCPICFNFPIYQRHIYRIFKMHSTDYNNILRVTKIYVVKLKKAFKTIKLPAHMSKIRELEVCSQY